MHSRLPSVITGLVLALSFTNPALALRFTDIAGSPYEPAIMALADAGALQGYLDGSVRPSGFLSRAEALKVLIASDSVLRAETERMRASMPPIALFADVYQRAWYAPYLETAFRHGIVEGYGDGTFRPGRGLTPEEATMLVMRAYGGSPRSGDHREAAHVNDASGQWFRDAINQAVARNLIMRGSRLLVGSLITRGQFFDMVYRMREIQRRAIASFPEGGLVAVNPESSQVSTLPALPLLDPSNPETAALLAYASAKPFGVSIPGLGIRDLTVTHPLDATSAQGVLVPLQTGVGHLLGYPGEGSKIMIYGHSSGYPWDLSEYTKIFRTINRIAVGERVYVTYQRRLFVYQVRSKQTVAASDSTPFHADGGGEELILYTCWPPDSISQRYLVHAELLGVLPL